MRQQNVAERTHRSAMFVILVLVPIIAALAFLVLRPKTANPPESSTTPARAAAAPVTSPAGTPPANGSP